MNISDHESLWRATAEKFPSNPLRENFKTDVCIIGAGITGITLAYKLCKEGKKVVVLDKGGVGCGETGYTTAHISNVLDYRYFEIEKAKGFESTKLAMQSHSEAIDIIESIVKKEKIDCGFRRVDGYLFLSEGDKEEMLDRELETVKKLGMKNVEKLDHGPKGADLGMCLKFPHQAEFHPLKYLNALAEIITKNGGEIYKDSLVQKIEETEFGVTLRVENGHFVQAKTVVICTNAPCEDSTSFIYAKQAPYRTYVIVLEIPKDAVPEDFYWDTQKPFHYTRLVTLKNGETGLMVGGEDHKTGQIKEGVDPYLNLHEYAKEKFSMVKEVKYQWSGQINETMDRLALIGLNPGHKKVYVATGYSGSGMTYGTIASQLIGDLILEKKNPWSEIYDPGRLKLTGKLMKENLNVATEYFGDLLPQQHETLQKLENGSGVVINSGLNKIAVYKDKEGKICKFSATCPHLGCFVHWNTVERTWDCPCHGSRFDHNGKVITGPATKPLKQL